MHIQRGPQSKLQIEEVQTPVDLEEDWALAFA